MADTEQPDVTALTVQLLSAYLANNIVAHTDIADLIRATKAALTEEKAPEPVEPETPVHTPAVTARKSLASPDHILSLIDGKPYKALKRHLSSHGLTPERYRERYNLPFNYPMVAPGFSAARRAIAEKIGLGRRTAVALPEKTSEPSPPPIKIAAARPNDAQVPAAPVKPAPAKKAAADAAAVSPKATDKNGPTKASRATSVKRPAVVTRADEAEPVQTNVGADTPRTRNRTLNLFKPQKGEAGGSKTRDTTKNGTEEVSAG